MSRKSGLKLVYRGSVAERVLDQLTTDGGWIASSMLIDLLPGVALNTLQQSLKRLKAKGWIESRPLHENIGPQTEHEWRVHPDFEWPE